jgi:hypothetical protein
VARTANLGAATKESNWSRLGTRLADQVGNLFGNGRGITFMRPLDSARTGLDHPAVSDPSVFVVVGHGNSQFISDDRPITTVVGFLRDDVGLPSDTQVRADDLAQRIRASRWDGHKPIVLLSCNAGTDGQKSYAQRVSNLLGVPVAAGDGYVASGSRGSDVGSELTSDGSRLRLKGDQHRGLTWFTPKGP